MLTVEFAWSPEEEGSMLARTKSPLALFRNAPLLKPVDCRFDDFTSILDWMSLLTPPLVANSLCYDKKGFRIRGIWFSITRGG